MTIRVAAIQASPVILDAEATVHKAGRLLAEAAGAGAELAVLPETFVSLLLHKHRKLMPTHQERLFHGIGPGDDLRAVDTDCGRIGGLICWENRMPLARYAVYRQGPQIWAAPTADDSESWIVHMRAIAIESGAFVVSVPQYIPRSAFPEDFPFGLPEDDVFCNGGAVIVEPTSGAIVAGPLYGEEGMLVHDCDLRLGLHAKRLFDAVGHYSREDVLTTAGEIAPYAPILQSAGENVSVVKQGTAR